LVNSGSIAAASCGGGGGASAYGDGCLGYTVQYDGSNYVAFGNTLGGIGGGGGGAVAYRLGSTIYKAYGGTGKDGGVIIYYEKTIE
jgi:hypothetical protein